MKMPFFPLLCSFVFFWIVSGSAELNIKERIKLHKEWLEKREQLKAYYNNNNFTILPKFHQKFKGYWLTHENKYRKNETSLNEVLQELNESKNKNLQYNIANKSYIEEPETTNNSAKYLLTKEIEISNKTIFRNETKEDVSHFSTLISSNEQCENIIKLNQTTCHQLTDYSSLNTSIGNVMWSKWQPWTECSRSCGGGVMSQTRECKLRSIYNLTEVETISKECIGLYKKYRLCNEQRCLDSDSDFREIQCKKFNNETFRGKRYNWEAYVKEDAECELNCKPVGMSYFATLKKMVIDGTPCNNPANHPLKQNKVKAICVDGICKVILNSGIITGAFMNNGAVKCGNLICRPVSGIYTKNPLQNGYIHVATIPKAASNISITELKNSMNLLVLKYADQTYILNGDYTTSSSGIYNAAGAVFDYRRIDIPGKNTSSNGYRKFEGVTEWITSTGPITEPIHLMLFKAVAQEPNVGIKYEYLLPITSNESEESSLENISTETESPQQTTISNSTLRHSLKSGIITPMNDENGKLVDKRKRKFYWKIVGFTQCSKLCGGGTQSPVIRCVRENPMRYFKPKRCSHLTKPLTNENLIRCNTQPCPAYWKIADWSSCQCDSYVKDEQHFKKREIKCVQELGTGMVIQVPAVACSSEKPKSTEHCDCPKIDNNYQNYFEKDKQNMVINSIKNRPYANSKKTSTIYGNNTISKRAHPTDNRNNGIWLTSNWNEKCSSQCGSGVQYRSIFCDRSPPKTERCDLRSAPETTRQCASSENCSKAEWFIGPWSKCSGDCFNLIQSRSILCIQNGVIVQKVYCNISTMPEQSKSCIISEVADCKPKWHYSEWSECSKPCEEGTQRRVVKCFEPLNGELRPSDRCKYSERKPASQICNTQTCQSTDNDIQNELIQNDVAPVCKDVLADCHLVVQEHLCKFAYFKENCCQTCQSSFGY